MVFYKIVIHSDNLKHICKTHKEVSYVINDYLIENRIQSSLITNNIVSNWLCRKNKSKKYDFIDVIVFKEIPRNATNKSVKILKRD